MCLKSQLPVPMMDSTLQYTAICARAPRQFSEKLCDCTAELVSRKSKLRHWHSHRLSHSSANFTQNDGTHLPPWQTTKKNCGIFCDFLCNMKLWPNHVCGNVIYCGIEILICHATKRGNWYIRVCLSSIKHNIKTFRFAGDLSRTILSIFGLTTCLK